MLPPLTLMSSTFLLKLEPRCCGPTSLAKVCLTSTPLITALFAHIFFSSVVAVSRKRTPIARPSSMMISSTGQQVRTTTPWAMAHRMIEWK
jgi:hypothetical protein